MNLTSDFSLGRLVWFLIYDYEISNYGLVWKLSGLVSGPKLDS